MMMYCFNIPVTGYVATAGGVQEMELNAQTKHCSAKSEKQVKVSNGQWQWAGYIMADVCMKFPWPIYLDVWERELNAQP